MADGRIPELPLEVYSFIIDLGSREGGEYPAGDVRSTRNDNTGLPGSLQKYVSQSGVFRLLLKEADRESGYDAESGILRGTVPDVIRRLAEKNLLV
jgi:hypothetical protein